MVRLKISLFFITADQKIIKIAYIEPGLLCESELVCLEVGTVGDSSVSQSGMSTSGRNFLAEIHAAGKLSLRSSFQSREQIVTPAFIRPQLGIRR